MKHTGAYISFKLSRFVMLHIKFDRQIIQKYQCLNMFHLIFHFIALSHPLWGCYQGDGEVEWLGFSASQSELQKPLG